MPVDMLAAPGALRVLSRERRRSRVYAGNIVREFLDNDPRNDLA